MKVWNSYHAMEIVYIKGTCGGSERMSKWWKYAIVMLALSLAFSMQVNAKDTITKENFDYEWYLEKHPDLAVAIDGNNKDAVWSFYQSIGKPAGWNGRVAQEFLLNEENFDYVRYANENPDLLAVFGLDKVALYNHYHLMGSLEGRKGYATTEETNAKLRIYELADTITAGCVSDTEKIKVVHDWLVKNTAYDYYNYVLQTIPEPSYGMEGAVLYGKAVCQGYAEAFSYFMDALGIENEMVTGTANNGNGLWIGHAWNKVKLDGKWYFIDVTWDDPLPDRGANVYWYKYYLVEDSTFGGDHRPRN